MFDDSHNILKRERLGVRNTIPLPIAQGVMNPSLRNLVTKTVLIDSQFRQTIESVGAGQAGASRTRGVYNSTDYTVDLSESLRNVVSMELWQVQVPVSWYAFSCALGNVNYSLANQECVRTISEGNYTLQDILAGRMVGTVRGADESPQRTTGDVQGQVAAVEKACEAAVTRFEGSGVPYEGSGKADVTCSPDAPGTIGAHSLCFGLGGPNRNRLVNVGSVEYVFYKPIVPVGGGDQCGPCPPNSRINQNLGWSLGFRPGADGRIIAFPGVPADAAYDLFGPKYFVVVLDDFNNNRPNQGIVSTVNSQTLRAMPRYATQPGFGTTPTPSRTLTGNFVTGQNPAGTCRYKKRDPRRFTTKQLYTLNTILDERTPGGSLNPAQNAKRVEGPTASDSLCIIPLDGTEIYELRTAGLIKPGDDKTATFSELMKDATLLGGGAPYTKFGNQLQTRKREYFGPVNIDRVRVKLVDDKGQPVDLNGLDWAISLNVDMLYQY